MSAADMPFDANAFEKAKKAERLAALKDSLLTPVGTMELQPGQQTPITPLDAISSEWRQKATTLLRVLDPDAYAAYRKMKYGGGPDPDHATRMKAYEFAVTAFLRKSYKLANC